MTIFKKGFIRRAASISGFDDFQSFFHTVDEFFSYPVDGNFLSVDGFAHLFRHLFALVSLRRVVAVEQVDLLLAQSLSALAQVLQTGFVAQALAEAG
jgi:hypothetical protein